MSIEQIVGRIRAHPVDGDVQQMRQAFASLAGQGPQGAVESFGGIRTVQYGSGPPLLWLHGGGYVFGSPETHADAAAWLAEAAGMSVLVPDYRLAPEHVWPAQLDDVALVLDNLDRPVPLIGDSAGDHLALAIVRRRPDQISRLALISPNTDRTGRSATRASNSKTDLMNSDDDDAQLARMAMAHLDPSGPDASPLVADLSMLPPTFVTASTTEVLLDDSLLLIRALGRVGVPVTANIVPDMMHLWTLWPGQLEPARRTLARIAAFLADR